RAARRRRRPRLVVRTCRPASGLVSRRRRVERASASAPEAAGQPAALADTAASRPAGGVAGPAGERAATRLVGAGLLVEPGELDHALADGVAPAADVAERPLPRV